MTNRLVMALGLVVAVLIALWLIGVGVHVVSFLISLVFFLGFVALVTFVVAIVWRAVMQRR